MASESAPQKGRDTLMEQGNGNMFEKDRDTLSLHLVPRQKVCSISCKCLTSGAIPSREGSVGKASPVRLNISRDYPLIKPHQKSI